MPLVHVSTASVYDPFVASVQVREAAGPVDRYLTAFGASKAAAERLLMGRSDTVVLRPHAVHGPGDRTLLPRVLGAVRGRAGTCPRPGRASGSIPRPPRPVGRSTGDVGPSSGVYGATGGVCPVQRRETGVMEQPGHIEFVHRSWPADPVQLSAIRHVLAGWLAPLALTDDEVADVVLAVDEAAANAVRHAYGPEESGVVELTLWTEPLPDTDHATLCIEIVDHGHWQPPTERPVEGGRGIPLMTTMSESVLIHYDERGSRVLLRHRIPDPA